VFNEILFDMNERQAGLNEPGLNFTDCYCGTQNVNSAPNEGSGCGFMYLFSTSLRKQKMSFSYMLISEYK
jgi:hypothetical protein